MEKQKKVKRILSWLLITVMIISQFVSGNAITVVAAPESRAVTTTWRQFTAGSKNDNAKNKALLVLTNEEAKGLTNGSIQMTIKMDEIASKTQAYFAISAKDNINFSGTGVHDTAWFLQNVAATSSSWLDLNKKGLAAGQEATVKIRFNGTKVSLTVDDEAVEDKNGNTEFELPLLESLADGQIGICLSNPQKPLIFQGFTPVFHSNLICLPLFLPLRAKTRATFYSPPTTLSSSLAEVRFASLVE